MYDYVISGPQYEGNIFNDYTRELSTENDLIPIFWKYNLFSNRLIKYFGMILLQNNVDLNIVISLNPQLLMNNKKVWDTIIGQILPVKSTAFNSGNSLKITLILVFEDLLNSKLKIGSPLLSIPNNYEMSRTSKRSTLLNEEILNLFNGFPIDVLVYAINEYDFDISRFKDSRNNNILHLMVCHNYTNIWKFEESWPKIFHSCWNKWNEESLRPYYLAISMGIKDLPTLKALFVGHNNMSHEEDLIFNEARNKKISKFKQIYDEDDLNDK